MEEAFLKLAKEVISKSLFPQSSERIRWVFRRIPKEDPELQPFIFKEFEEFLEKEPQLVQNIHNEFYNSGGSLSLSSKEFAKFFRIDAELAEQLVNKLCSTGYYQLSESVDITTGQESKRLHIHSRFKCNYWLFSVLTDKEAKALLEIGVLLKNPFKSRRI